MKNLSLFDEAPAEAQSPTRRVQGGSATTDVILSAHVAGNAEVFAQVAELHLPEQSVVADLTYGKGVFWQRVPVGKYNLLFSDLDAKVCQDPIHGVAVKSAVDSRDTPFEDAFLDCVVFDPPYMEGLFRVAPEHLAGAGTHTTFRHHYSNGKTTLMRANNLSGMMPC